MTKENILSLLPQQIQKSNSTPDQFIHNSKINRQIVLDLYVPDILCLASGFVS